MGSVTAFPGWNRTEEPSCPSRGMVLRIPQGLCGDEGVGRPSVGAVFGNPSFQWSRTNDLSFRAQFVISTTHSWKSYSANQLQRKHQRTSGVWQGESFDRIARNQHEIDEKIRYILRNPFRRWPNCVNIGCNRRNDAECDRRHYRGQDFGSGRIAFDQRNFCPMTAATEGRPTTPVPQMPSRIANAIATSCLKGEFHTASRWRVN